LVIVDDDQTTRDALALFFEQANFDVATAGTFEEGRLALTRDPPDLLLADIRLGDFNGLQLLATSPQPLPAIIMTGYADPVLEAEARAMGAEYVVKPVSLPELLALIQKKLATPRG
jgi:DNA-binding response OmpR family regulator